jgi:predicted Zn-dependent peptidase
MKRRTFLASLAALGLPRLALATSPSAPSVVRERLPSGLTVLVRENPAAPVVAVSLQVAMGLRFENIDTAGAANLLQHVMVKGTGRRNALEIAEAAEGIGGSISASGDTDFSEIRGAALARHWPRLLELIAEVALSPTLPEAEVENERRAILSQIRNREDQPFPLTFDTLLKNLYGPHPYGLPALGRREVVERLDRAALREHYERYYRGDRMVLAVSGQVVAKDLLNEAARLFAPLPRGAGAIEPPPPPPAAEASRHVVERPAAQAQVLFGYRAPALARPDYTPMKVLSALLGGGMAGRLFVELRDRQGLAYVVGALYPSRRDPSFFGIHTATAPANMERVEEGITREVERIRREPPSTEEVGRARAYLLGNLAMDRRTNARQAWYLAFFELQGAGHDFLDRYVAAADAVTPGDVGRVARTYLTDPTIAILRPIPR